MSNYWQKAEGFFNFEGYYNSIVNNAKQGQRLVEVGIYKGKSILYLAEGLNNKGVDVELYGVDTLLGSVEHNDAKNEILTKYFDNIEPLRDQITTIVTTSLQASKLFENESLDFVFIDASHDYENVKADILAWMPKVKKGGILSGHDYNKHWPGVMQAVDEIINHTKTIHGDVWEITL
jgi:predicted O-methyltransferase YrrM